jgi:hypothetical protein
MKSWLILIFTLSPLIAMARSSELLRCLGNEEKRLHLKKEIGPLYDLNQRLISEIVQIPNVEMTKVDFHDICSRKRPSESLHLLYLTIHKGKSLFEIPVGLSGMSRSMTKGMIDDYVDASKEIFLNFITQIQTTAPTPNCLKEEVPELDTFFTDIKYLQEDVDMKAIFRGRDETIFNKLLTYSEAFKKCQARLKKKLKPSSKAVDKKR